MAKRLNYSRPTSRHFSILEEEWRLGHLSDDDAVAALLKSLLKQSRRVGLSDGKPVRTFHLRIIPFKASPTPRRAKPASQPKARTRSRVGKSTANREVSIRRRSIAKLTYIHRAARYKNRKDLVLTGGRSIPQMVAVVEALWSCSFRRDAALLNEIVCELPAGTPVQKCRKIVAAMVARFGRQGCPYTFAVHDHDGNLHVHILVAARPCREVAPGYWIAEAQGRQGAPGFKLFNGADAVRRYRLYVAVMVNDICNPAVEFHPGRRKDTGLEGEPEQRCTRSELQERHRALWDELLAYVQMLRRKGLNRSQAEKNPGNSPDTLPSILPTPSGRPGRKPTVGKPTPRSLVRPSQPEFNLERRLVPSPRNPKPIRPADPGLSLTAAEVKDHLGRVALLDFEWDARSIQKARARMLEAPRTRLIEAKSSAEVLIRYFEFHARAAPDFAEASKILRRNLRLVDQVLTELRSRPPQPPSGGVPPQRNLKSRPTKVRDGYER